MLLVFSFTNGEDLMTDRLATWEARIVHGGLRILTILTFIAFFGWAVVHLWKMFA
jgi:hypothetical protein